MRFVTWNVRKQKNALDLAIKYMLGVNTGLLCLQELPDGWNADLGKSATSKLKVLTLPGESRVALITSLDIACTNGPFVFVPGDVRDTYDRMLGAVLTIPAIGTVSLVGVHFPDRRTLPPGASRDRVLGSLASDLRHFCPEGPLVLLGDFNANPFNEEIAGSRFLAAVRDRYLLDSTLDLLPVRKEPTELPVFHRGVFYDSLHSATPIPGLAPGRRLYNPMWRWLAERECQPRGTHRYAGPDTIIEWTCVDQILVSKELVPRIEAVRIIASIGDNVMIDDKRTDIPSQFGDHLPVELVLKETAHG